VKPVPVMRVQTSEGLVELRVGSQKSVGWMRTGERARLTWTVDGKPSTKETVAQLLLRYAREEAAFDARFGDSNERDYRV